MVRPALFAMILLTACSQQEKSNKSTYTPLENPVAGKIISSAKGPVAVPLDFGLNDDYSKYGATRIIIKDPEGNTVFTHSGEWKNWGSESTGIILKKIGAYEVIANFITDSNSIAKELHEHFEVSGSESRIDLTVALVNDRGDGYNMLTANKYYGNELGIKLKRVWNPQAQFKRDTTLLPEYEVLNTSDSILYGIYHRFSTSLLISWVQLHDLGYLYFQKMGKNGWEYMSCNVPRVNMDLKPGDKGSTLKDMVLDCSCRNFSKGGKYRILFEYGINNTTVRRPLINNSWTYVEPHIYQIFDEFSL